MAQKAVEGVDCMLTIDTGVTNHSDVELVINETTFITAATVTIPYVYSKEIISDDVAIVSPMNWMPSSFHNNRESTVALLSGCSGLLRRDVLGRLLFVLQFRRIQSQRDAD